MSGPLGSQQWMYASGGFYPFSIDQSLRFNDNDSAYLNRTPASAGNLDAWTFSAWVKRANLGVGTQTLFGASSDVNNWMYIGFTSSNTLTWNQADSGSVTQTLTTSQLFRDVGSWYHIVCKYDSAQATAADRQEIYINGTKVTAFGTATRLGQNVDSRINRNIGHTIGRLPYSAAGYFDGYMAEINFIDGTALDATSFGETSNGVWVPLEYSGSYGTNGFYLSFADSAAIGDDLSGNTNDFTANNLAASDVVPDSPTNNFATLNSIEPATSTTFSEGNLKATATASTWNAQAGTFFVSSGKWYAEVYNVNGNGSSLRVGVGIAEESYNPVSYLGQYSNSWGWYDTGAVYNNASVSSNESTYTAGDILGIGLDLDTNTVSFYKNGTLDFSKSISAGNWAIATSTYVSSSSAIINYGQDSTFAGATTAGGNSDANGYGDFKHSVPSGFLALCSANLPEPAIGPNSTTTSDQHFNTVLYTGDGTNGQAITGVGHQPDFLWIKSRSGTAYHELHDSVRGAGTRLFSNDTAAESTVGTVSSFDSDGFTVSRNSAYDGTNQSGVSFVGWNWKAGGTAVSNTDGNITSSVSANTTSRMSVITYTGSGGLVGGSNPTFGHGLGVAPSMLIFKCRSDGATNWLVWHQSLGGPDKYLVLNSTGAVGTDTAWLSNTAPTSSVITTDNGGWGAVNGSGRTYVCYAFADVEGHLKCGSYVGNGSTDGTFVYTGFRPAWVMIKNTIDVSHWNIWDSARTPYNVITTGLYPSSSDADQTGTALYVDYTSNGFKLRSSHNSFNGSNDTFIYLAFAESPFKYANAR